MRRFSLLALWLLAGAAAAQTQTSVCEVLKSPSSFDGKVVRLRATVIRGFEVFAIEDSKDSDCGRIWLEYPGAGPEASISFGERMPKVQRPPVKLRKDEDLKRFQALLEATVYPRSPEISCMDCWRYEVTATLTGRIDAAGKGRGFGHLNAYSAELVLESVSEVSTKDRISQYDAKLYSPTPVRFPTGYLAGRVLDSAGRPVADVQVEAGPAEESQEESPWKSFRRRTGKDGDFSFEVLPGRYRLGVNLEDPPSPEVPFPLTYYPGAATEKDATVVTVADGQRVKDLVIHLPPGLQPRAVPVSVVWPDGKPVEKANVWLVQVSRPYAVVGGPVSHTGRDGFFNLQGFVGIDYVVYANIYVKPSYTPYCAEKKTLKAGDRIEGRLVMVLTRTGDVCKSFD